MYGGEISSLLSKSYFYHPCPYWSCRPLANGSAPHQEGSQAANSSILSKWGAETSSA
jgi:hypothetical protein